jgi:hypothetical protein
MRLAVEGKPFQIGRVEARDMGRATVDVQIHYLPVFFFFFFNSIYISQLTTRTIAKTCIPMQENRHRNQRNTLNGDGNGITLGATA